MSSEGNFCKKDMFFFEYFFRREILPKYIRAKDIKSLPHKGGRL